jgi:hypothetical protein
MQWLHTLIGAFFVQSTHAGGFHKTTDCLYQDILMAMMSIGMACIAIVCMDGACKAVLRRIELTHAKVFAQRCSTHGWDLLQGEIGAMFVWEMTMCIRLMKFVLNHDGIFDIFSKIEGSTQLLALSDARFASQIYCVERIVKDRYTYYELLCRSM